MSTLGHALGDERSAAAPGRLMRAHEGKTSVRVYDYADIKVPVLRAMHARRLTTYKSLGFTQAQQTLASVVA